MSSPRFVLLICFALVASLAASVPAYGQIDFTWFDTNPDQSNLDGTNPNGSSGGRVQRMAAAADGSRVYGASEWGGLYASFDQGLTWDRVNE